MPPTTLLISYLHYITYSRFKTYTLYLLSVKKKLEKVHLTDYCTRDYSEGRYWSASIIYLLTTDAGDYRKPHSDWQVSGASFLAPENLCQKTCASYTVTLRKFLVQECGYTLWENPISSRSSNQRRSFTTETCLK